MSKDLPDIAATALDLTARHGDAAEKLAAIEADKAATLHDHEMLDFWKAVSKSLHKDGPRRPRRGRR